MLVTSGGTWGDIRRLDLALTPDFVLCNSMHSAVVNSTAVWEKGKKPSLYWLAGYSQQFISRVDPPALICSSDFAWLLRKSNK